MKRTRKKNGKFLLIRSVFLEFISFSWILMCRFVELGQIKMNWLQIRTIESSFLFHPLEKKCAKISTKTTTTNICWPIISLLAPWANSSYDNLSRSLNRNWCSKLHTLPINRAITLLQLVRVYLHMKCHLTGLSSQSMGYIASQSGNHLTEIIIVILSRLFGCALRLCVRFGLTCMKVKVWW